jgi:hypothetical protein
MDGPLWQNIFLDIATTASTNYGTLQCRNHDALFCLFDGHDALFCLFEGLLLPLLCEVVEFCKSH